jgi:hypothetical protein
LSSLDLTCRNLDSHAIVVRKELRGAALPGADLPWSGQKRKLGECGVTGRQGVSRECDEVKAMVATGMIARASLL